MDGRRDYLPVISDGATDLSSSVRSSATAAAPVPPPATWLPWCRGGGSSGVGWLGGCAGRARGEPPPPADNARGLDRAADGYDARGCVLLPPPQWRVYLLLALAQSTLRFLVLDTLEYLSSSEFLRDTTPSERDFALPEELNNLFYLLFNVRPSRARVGAPAARGLGPCFRALSKSERERERERESAPPTREHHRAEARGV